VLESYIDQTAAYISEAVIRDNNLWKNTGNHQQQIATIKTFLSYRIPWMTDNLGSYSLCSNVSVPPLVITRIMYHPSTSLEFPEGDDLEYIEITNNGDQTVSLTGIYFAGTCITYQFPPNSSITPHSSLILASDQQTFRLKYGFSPFGKYTKHLSNKSENIVLSDGFGNIIDNVNYSDTVPWPEADGNGYYLKLISAGLDNNDPTSWIASNDVITSSGEIIAYDNLQIYPNPVSDVLTINSDSEIKTLSLADLYGHIIITVNPDSQFYELNMSQLSEGIYFLRIGTSSSKIFVRKIIKN
jgi:hypothetical protein